MSSFTLVLSAAVAALVTALSPLGGAGATNGSTAVFHVDCGAAEAGDGTPAHPWRDLLSVMSHGVFHPGDEILLRRGSTCSGRLAPTGSGSPGRPIELGAYGIGAAPTIAGGGTTEGTGALELDDVHDWTVQDLHVTNHDGAAETDVYRSGVLVQDRAAGRLAGIELRRLHVDGVTSRLTYGGADPRQFGGITLLTEGGSGDGFDSPQILDSSISRVGRTGIAVFNDEYPASADTKVRISGDTVAWARGDSVILRGATDSRIDHNVSAHGAALWPCRQCGGVSPATADAGIWPILSRGIRIDHNEVYGEHIRGGDGEGFDIDQSAVDVTLEDNYAHDNAGGGILLCGSRHAVVRFNILQNNEASALAFIGKFPAVDTAIYNNTIYQSRATPGNVVRTFDGRRGSGLRFFNNVVFTYDTSRYVWPTQATSSANTYVGVHRAGEPHGRGTSFKNPGLRAPGTGRIGLGSLNGYRPKPSSRPPAGAALPASVMTDFFGHRVDPKHAPRGAAAS